VTLRDPYSATHKFDPSSRMDVAADDLRQDLRGGQGENTVNRQPRWVVVHAGSRDRYQLPLTFEENGALESFVTDWYSRVDRLPTFVERLLGSKISAWVSRRHCPGLDSRKVIDSKFRATVQTVARRFLHFDTNFRRSNERLGARAGVLASSAGAHLFSTSYYGAAAFRAYSGKGQKVLFQLHPAPRYLRQLYGRYLQFGGLFEGLLDEAEMAVSDDELSYWEAEADLADRIVVASTFSALSVRAANPKCGECMVVPYGTNLVPTVPRAAFRPNSQLKVLFVGSKVARKGLHVLLEAWRRLGPKSAELRVAGANARDSRIMSAFPGVAIELPRLTQAELDREFAEADVFVMPSLAEGFGHVYLEALACGTPIVGTENTSVPDLLKEGPCGFVVDAGSVDSLAAQLETLLVNPRILWEMRTQARLVAERHTWPHFRNQLWKALN